MAIRAPDGANKDINILIDIQPIFFFSKVSADITRKMDLVRSHRVRELEDLKETDRKAERAIKSELERKQQEVEGVLYINLSCYMLSFS